MSDPQLHEDHSTVDGIPADMADLQSDVIQKHVKAKTQRLQDHFASLRYPEHPSLLQMLQDIQASQYMRHEHHSPSALHPSEGHDGLHSGNEVPQPAPEEEPQTEHERQPGIAVPQALYTHLSDPHLQHNQHSLAQYHHNVYYQHLAAAQFHQAHTHDSHVSAAYQAPVSTQLLHSYGLGVEEPAVGVEAARSQDLDTMNEHDAAAHLAALRNPLRVDGEMMENHAMSAADRTLQAVEGHPYYDPAEAHEGAEMHQGRYGSAAKKRSWRHVIEHDAAVDLELLESGRVKRRQHRRPDRLCHFEGCFVTPTYNYPGQKKRIFCVTHKKEGMVNVVAKRCAHLECPVNPRFNYEGQPRGLYCSEHKLQGMVNVIDRRCQEPNCKKFPSHNYPGMHKKLYCATHKKEGMVDMSHGGPSMGH